MSYNWRYFYDFALFLNKQIENFDQETIHRNIISRTYYAAHHHLRDLLPNVPVYSSNSINDSIHVKIIREFKNKAVNNIELAKLCDDYSKLFDWRKYSDYEINLINPEQKSNLAILATEKIFEIKYL